jgi:LmbE family N-acetylglucosaminyl deacetylase
VNVLVVAAHPDDETLGCGGSLLLHRERGDELTVAFLTSGELGLPLPPEDARRIREEEAAAAGGILGVRAQRFLRLPDWYLTAHRARAADLLAALVAETAPKLVLAPSKWEAHPDHRAAWAAARDACHQRDPRPVLRGYEVWTPLPYFDLVESIDPVAGRKREAIRCYASQLERVDYLGAIDGLNRYRGALAGGCTRAEVFASDGLADEPPAWWQVTE